MKATHFEQARGETAHAFGAQKLDALLEEVGPGEVPFQLHYQASDLRAFLATCLALPDKKARPPTPRPHTSHHRLTTAFPGRDTPPSPYKTDTAASFAEVCRQFVPGSRQPSSECLTLRLIFV